MKQGKYEGFDSWDQPSDFFGLCDLETGPMVLKNNRDFLPSPYLLFLTWFNLSMYE